MKRRTVHGTPIGAPVRTEITYISGDTTIIYGEYPEIYGQILSIKAMVGDRKFTFYENIEYIRRWRTEEL